jgi:pimeloyl-ACP methyl ester carboxylesterase
VRETQYFADPFDPPAMWAPLAIVLAKDHTVIVPDLRGMGMSDHPDAGYAKKNQAVDIAGVMDALKGPEGRPGHT